MPWESLGRQIVRLFDKLLGDSCIRLQVAWSESRVSPVLNDLGRFESLVVVQLVFTDQNLLANLLIELLEGRLLHSLVIGIRVEQIVDGLLE